MLSDFERGLVVGLIEGEGAIFLSKRAENRFDKSSHGFYLVPCLDVTNTDFRLMSEYFRIIGKILGSESNKTKLTTTAHGDIETIKRSKSRWKDKWKIGYRVRICDKGSIIRVLSEIGNEFVSDSKKKKSMYLLEWCLTRSNAIQHFRRQPYSERELEIYDILRVLNKRGR